MLRGHIFVVNENTLPIHLNFMFAGTGAGDKDNNIGLLADMCRVKEGDFIFFYIEGNTSKKGRFFGIFKAYDNNVYHLTGKDAEYPNLEKKLIYRKRIKPYKIFPKGVLEWIVLDKLPVYAREVIWTLIYRKMKGRRGNTMLFPWETEKLISLIQDTNDNIHLKDKKIIFDRNEFEIKTNGQHYDSNNKNNKTILGDIAILEASKIKNETYFQAYILQKISLFNNTFYPEIFGKNIVWIGNEVYAGSGMQKIDLITIEKLDETSYIYRLIELKHFKSSDNIDNAPSQLGYYINWSKEDNGGHLLGAKKYNIKPVLVNFSKTFGSISDNIRKQIKALDRIAYNPEIYEIKLNNNTLEHNRIL